MKKNLSTITALLAITLSLSAQAAPRDFHEAKDYIRIIAGENAKSFYCGCDITWNKRTGTSGRIDHESCGYRMRSDSDFAKVRANRVEVEHIVPISWIGKQYQCGTRKECQSSSAAYNRAEGDLHGLVPAIGEVNGDRSNLRFGVVSGGYGQYGACQFKVDFKNNVVEPADSLKGMIARVHFYYADHYNLRMSDSQKKLMAAWDKQYPVSDWERDRESKVAKIMGHHNPYVTGDRIWGSVNTGMVTSKESAIQEGSRTLTEERLIEHELPIIGNKKSNIYHLPEGCPSYSKVSHKNQVHFRSEHEALSNGYRKAGNCR